MLTKLFVNLLRYLRGEGSVSGAVHLETLGHSLLHVEGVELHVLLAPAALHRLGLGPLHEHLPVLASINADDGDNY
eukprot:UN05127